jgi:hypothetical protein
LAAPLDAAEADKMAWLLRETFEPQQLTPSSIFDGSAPNQCVVEVGPRTNFSTAFSTNATSITRSVGLDKVTRLEPSRRYLLTSTRWVMLLIPQTLRLSLDLFVYVLCLACCLRCVVRGLLGMGQNTDHSVFGLCCVLITLLLLHLLLHVSLLLQCTDG